MWVSHLTYIYIEGRKHWPGVHYMDDQVWHPVDYFGMQCSLTSCVAPSMGKRNKLANCIVLHGQRKTTLKFASLISNPIHYLQSYRAHLPEDRTSGASSFCIAWSTSTASLMVRCISGWPVPQSWLPPHLLQSAVKRNVPYKNPVLFSCVKFWLVCFIATFLTFFEGEMM